jgi:hypothetical protein
MLTATPTPSRTATPTTTPTATPTVPPPACPGAVAWSNAGNYVGQRARVEGVVVGANFASGSAGQPTFLDVGLPYPDPGRFTVLIWGDDRANFPLAPDVAFRGEKICVSGVIELYAGVAEIEVSSPAQIVIE